MLKLLFTNEHNLRTLFLAYFHVYFHQFFFYSGSDQVPILNAMFVVFENNFPILRIRFTNLPVR